MAAEKTEKALIAGIEHFDTSKLKPTETQEKNPLPNKEGKIVSRVCMSSFVLCILSSILQKIEISQSRLFYRK